MKETIDSTANRSEGDRTGLDIEDLKRSVLDHLLYTRGTMPELATPLDFYHALACSVRDRIQHRWIDNVRGAIQEENRIVIYPLR